MKSDENVAKFWHMSGQSQLAMNLARSEWAPGKIGSTTRDWLCACLQHTSTSAVIAIGSLTSSDGRAASAKYGSTECGLYSVCIQASSTGSSQEYRIRKTYFNSLGNWGTKG